MSEASDVFIVKLGGSLISDKDRYCTPNTAVIHEFGRLLRSRWDELQTKLIIVLGGGSYGNGVTHRYHLQQPAPHWKLSDLSMLTLKTFELMSVVIDIFTQEGVPCYPFQASSYLMSSNGRPEKSFIEPVKHVLSMGVLPILSGDMVFDMERRFVIFSSDGIPGLFVGRLPIRRVVMLTNVPGVMTDTTGEARVIARVTRENCDAVLECAGPSRQLDVSGGMKNKVKALIRIAELGVESVICDGRTPAVLFAALFDSIPPGSVIEPWAPNHK